MVVQLSPGVRITEQVVSGSVPNTATTAAALVGAPVRGNIDEVVSISTLENLFQEYGYPTLGSNFHYSAIGYLLQGQALKCLRVVKNALYGGVEIKKNGSAQANAGWATGLATPKSAYAFGTDGLLAILAKDPGVWNNGLKVKVTHDDGVSSERLGVGDGSTLTFGGTLAKKPVLSGSLSVTDGVETFVDNGDGTLTGSAGGTGTYTPSTGVFSISFFVAPTVATRVLATYRQSTSVNAFTIAVYAVDANGVYNQVEQFVGCSRKVALDPYGTQRYVVQRVNSSSKYIFVIDNTDEADTVDVKEQTSQLAMLNGSDGDPITDAEIMTGWDMFANKDDVAVQLLINAGYATVAVQNKILSIAEARQDCIPILDTPQGMTDVDDIIAYRNTSLNANTSFGGMFAGWQKIYDQWNGMTVTVPASGFVAGMFAYSDQKRAPWWAAAGADRGRLNVSGVETIFNEDERDRLCQAQINPIQSFPGQGIQIYGNMTLLQSPSPLQSMNVRRMLLFVEAGLKVLLSGVVFDQNTSTARASVALAIDQFLGAIASANGLASKNVVCDDTNNGPAVLAAREMHIDISLVPEFASEKIQVGVSVSSTGLSFTETVGLAV